MRRGESRSFGMLLAALGAVVGFAVAGATVLAAPLSAVQSQDVPVGWSDISAMSPALSSLAATARRAVSQDDVWVGYTFPLRAGVHIGCEQPSGRAISFGSDDIQFRIESQGGEVGNEPCDDRFGLFLRFDGNTSEVAEARLLTLRRAARRLDEPVVWAGEFLAAQSVAFLRPAVLDERGSLSTSSQRAREHLLSAIAVHDDRAAAEVVLAALDPSHASELRESAVFWTSQVAGNEGLQRLLDVARNDADAEVRMASIFWLGQVAGERATVDLAEIAEDDPNTEVARAPCSR